LRLRDSGGSVDSTAENAKIAEGPREPNARRDHHFLLCDPCVLGGLKKDAPLRGPLKIGTFVWFAWFVDQNGRDRLSGQGTGGRPDV
jgi:hypothetical protein